MGFVRELLRKCAAKKDKKRQRQNFKERLVKDISENPERYSDPEMKEVVDYVRKHGISVFPYSYASKYDPSLIEVYKDPASGLRYILMDGRRLYSRKGGSDNRAARYFNGLYLEQDPLSPHCYSADGFGIGEGSVLFDIGCAEGNYTLANIDKVSKAFLFEVDEEWLEALRRTFEPWKDKVVIINKFVSDADGEDTVTVDSVVRDYGIEEPVFLKMDVEGAESSVLRGAAETLKRTDTKAVVCTYHRQDDHAELSAMMKTAGYGVKTSKGYMLFTPGGYSRLEPPFFRRGVIYCTKSKGE